MNFRSRLLCRLATIAEKREIAVQTLNDVTTDEAAEFAARPPPCKKKELIPLQGIFSDIDKYACNVSRSSRLCFPELTYQGYDHTLNWH